ncbi:MAG: 2OG-Fe(II) oxygenase [Alphaproteobacteria bacterium]|nr:2OG-Fe(II) oxygenase [Alphaproteobacteria bacterium]
MTYLDIDKFEAADATREPFEFLTVPAFVSGDALKAVNEDFPKMERAGNFPLEKLTYGPKFQTFLDEIRGDAFREAIERKFNMNLKGLKHLITIRGFAEPSDGNIHTDVPSKVVTALIYLNENWDSKGGMLRLLRDGKDIENYIAEVPPIGGTLLMFKRSDKSWHGHKPFSGVRRTIQINWIDESVSDTAHGIGKFGRRVKKVLGLVD